MKKVIRDDYIFNINIESATAFYSDLPQPFSGLSGYLPELTQFLASLGIDIEKPVKYDLNDTYDLLYKTFGTFTTREGYELAFYGEEKYVLVVIFQNEAKNKLNVLDIIYVEVFGIMLKKSIID